MADRSPADPSPLKALLGPAATRFGLDDAMATGSLWTRWEEIVGGDVAAHAQPTSLRDGVLRVRADSPVWAHEIGYLTEEIRSKANAALGRSVIREVKVWNAPGAPVPERRSGSPGDGHGTSGEEAPTDHIQGHDGDPLEALDKARKAWLERRARGRGTDH